MEYNINKLKNDKSLDIDVVNIAPGDYKTEIFSNRVDRTENASPYYDEYINVINNVNSKMDHGRDPSEIAELVSKIINKKNPKINYLVGGFLEKKITLKSLFPDKIFAPFFISLIFNFFFTCQALFLYNDKGLLLLKII